MAHLVTGYAGEEHIKSADQGSFNASFFGTGEYVMEAGNQFDASIMDNNTVRILDGDILMQGRHIRIEPNTYEDITITTGTAGKNRNDLICMQYKKEASSGIETAEIVVVKGSESTGTASDPEYTHGDIIGGDVKNQMPIYRVKVEGVVLSAIEPLFTTIPTFQALAEQYEKKFKDECDSYIESLEILDTMEEVSANTQANKLAGALALKEMNGEVTELNNNLTSLGKSVSDGKTLVANAITAKGITTATDASFQTMADNILSINVTKLITVKFGVSGYVTSWISGTNRGYTEGTVTANVYFSGTLIASKSFIYSATQENSANIQYSKNDSFNVNV